MIEPGMIGDYLRSPAVLGTVSVLISAYLLRLFLSGPKRLSLPVAEVIPGKGTESLMAARAKVYLHRLLDYLHRHL